MNVRMKEELVFIRNADTHVLSLKAQKNWGLVKLSGVCVDGILCQYKNMMLYV